MEAISGLDATFLYAETPTSPMHIGSVAVIEGALDYRTFKAHLESRIHQIPRFRQRLVSIPFSIDYPYWVDDPNFNINLHLKRLSLPKPHSWQELRTMSSSIFSEHLDRSRPLWSIAFVEGIDGIDQVPKGSIALISKVHHVAVDGMAGANLLSLIFEMTDKATKPKAPRPFKPKPLPNEVNLLAKSARSFAKKPLKFPKIIKDTVASTLKAGFVTRSQLVELPTSPFSAPKTSLNGIISAERKWNTAILSLERVKALKNIMGTTLNDVVLAICSGALRKYLLDKDSLPKKSLVAMVPVSTRAQIDNGNSDGNQLSMMLVKLATGIEDPIERLQTIHDNTNRGKTYQGAVGAKALINLAESVPFGVASQAARVYSRFNLAKMHKPAFNVTITNVPGPPIPLYCQGHKLHSIMGTAPIIDGMGMIITIFSYDGKLTISPTSDANSMPDMDTFTSYILDSANELEEEVLSKGKKIKAAKKRVAKPKSDKFFTALKKYLKDNPKFLKPNSGTYQFVINKPDSTWSLNLNKPPGTIKKGELKKADVTITLEDKNLMKIVKGDLTFQLAFIQGRLKIDGDNKKAMRLAKILSLLPQDLV